MFRITRSVECSSCLVTALHLRDGMPAVHARPRENTARENARRTVPETVRLRQGECPFVITVDSGEQYSAGAASRRLLPALIGEFPRERARCQSVSVRGIP